MTSEYRESIESSSVTLTTPKMVIQKVNSKNNMLPFLECPLVNPFELLTCKTLRFLNYRKHLKMKTEKVKTTNTIHCTKNEVFH